jgi:hypothetical protein
MSKMTSHKYITYYMAHNGRSTNYPKIQAKVDELYAHMDERQRKAIALALYHSGRCCHLQGYFRHYMKDIAPNSIEGQSAAETRALLDEDCMRLVRLYDPTTVTCWYGPISNHKGAYSVGQQCHQARAARRSVNEAKAKATKDRIDEVGYLNWANEGCST